VAGTVSLKMHPPKRLVPQATHEPVWLRWLMIGIAVAFLVLFIFLPLAMVFISALEKGVRAYLGAISEPDALSAIYLTLLTAAIAVPLN
jgi:sulfate/thiosulfate transport system permease protein